MAVLELEELIVYGLEKFIPDLTGQRLKLLVEILFRSAMASGGSITAWDRRIMMV